MVKTKNKRESICRLEPGANLKAIEDIHRRICAALDTADRVLIDTSSVEKGDVALVQLLLSARATARAQDKDVKLTEPANGKFRGVLERGGFLADADARRFWLLTDEVC